MTEAFSALAGAPDLDEPSLKRILTEPKNALVKQYQRLFEMEGVDLTVAEEALGARALAVRRHNCLLIRHQTHR